MKSGNVILFPKWQKILEEESIAAIKEKKFDEALDKLNDLLSYQVKNHDIYTGKLICLMELERFDEAQELCEALIEEKDKYYYQYIHIYLTLLFQTNQYENLMEIVEDELEKGKVPSHLKESFNQLYSMSEKLSLSVITERSNLYLEELYDAVNQDNHMEQWRLIHKLRKMGTALNEKVASLLVNDHVHPLNKSAIVLWMKQQNISKPVEVHKFGIEMKVIPNETPDMKQSIIADHIENRISEVEQSNPSLYSVMETLLGHFLYVMYPITPPVEDADYIAEALHTIGNEYLNMEVPPIEDENIKKYIQEIKTADILYASIIDD